MQLQSDCPEVWLQAMELRAHGRAVLVTHSLLDLLPRPCN